MANSNSKITQIKLTNTSYDIDVASSLKDTSPQADSTNVVTSGALYNEQEARIAADAFKLDKKPDGSISLLDENNKINSHYISDTILGQLKFGGAIYYRTDASGVSSLYLLGSASLNAFFKDTAADHWPDGTEATPAIPSVVSLQINSTADNGWGYIYTSTATTPAGYTCTYTDISEFEGYYFISNIDSEEITSSDQTTSIIPKLQKGDWLLACNNSWIKVDNTDTITHIIEPTVSLLEIEGSGLKLKHLNWNAAESKIQVTAPLKYTEGSQFTLLDVGGMTVQKSAADEAWVRPGEIYSSNTVTGGTVSGGTIRATTKMTAPTPNGADVNDVVNIDYFKNNATKVNWKNIDSDVHVVNSHNLTVDGNLTVAGDLSFGADSHLVFGTIEGTDFIADYAKVKNAPTEADDVVNKAYFDANKGSSGDGLPSGATEGAFLRYKSGAAVWEIVPSAEDNTF